MSEANAAAESHEGAESDDEPDRSEGTLKTLGQSAIEKLAQLRSKRLQKHSQASRRGGDSSRLVSVSCAASYGYTLTRGVITTWRVSLIYCSPTVFYRFELRIEGALEDTAPAGRTRSTLLPAYWWVPIDGYIDHVTALCCHNPWRHHAIPRCIEFAHGLLVPSRDP